MNRRIPYRTRIAGAPCDMDAPRTPYAAAREQHQRGFQLVTRFGRQHIVRTIGAEGLAILLNQRFW